MSGDKSGVITITSGTTAAGSGILGGLIGYEPQIMLVISIVSFIVTVITAGFLWREKHASFNEITERRTREKELHDLEIQKRKIEIEQMKK